MNTKIPEVLQHQIRDHGEDGYPHEVCGALLGTFQEEACKVDQVLRLENLREENRERRYEIQPEDQLKARERAEEEGLEVVGFYHSHPDHPARPSDYDLEHAWPRYLYVIVSVREGEAKDLNAWRLEQNGADSFQNVSIYA